jgi:asparagine synthase (glutamine-hydrolysing)
MLTKVDRASMAVSLECRLPLADHRVVELASRLPLRLKIHQGQGKVLLRRILDKYVPRELIDRPKMGFGVPIADWLRGPLQEWASELLSPARLSEGGLLDPRPIEQAWKEHLSGRRSRHIELWSVLMFQAWRREMPWAPDDERESPTAGARVDSVLF